MSRVNRREYLMQEFRIYHPLFEKVVEAKMEKCLKHGHIRQFMNENLGKHPAMTIEAPFIQEMRIKRRGELLTTRQTTRSKNTIIRSRTSEPRLRKRLQELGQEVNQDINQENWIPSISMRMKRYERNKDAISH